MQETLFIKCRGDVNGRSRLGPMARRRSRIGEAGGLRPGAALTSPKERRASFGSVEEPASRAIDACACAAAAIAATRSAIDRVPCRGQRAGSGRPLRVETLS